MGIITGYLQEVEPTGPSASQQNLLTIRFADGSQDNYPISKRRYNKWAKECGGGRMRVTLQLTKQGVVKKISCGKPRY